MTTGSRTAPTSGSRGSARRSSCTRSRLDRGRASRSGRPVAGVLLSPICARTSSASATTACFRPAATTARPRTTSRRSFEQRLSPGPPRLAATSTPAALRPRRPGRSETGRSAARRLSPEPLLDGAGLSARLHLAARDYWTTISNILQRRHPPAPARGNPRHRQGLHARPAGRRAGAARADLDRQGVVGRDEGECPTGFHRERRRRARSWRAWSGGCVVGRGRRRRSTWSATAPAASSWPTSSIYSLGPPRMDHPG